MFRAALLFLATLSFSFAEELLPGWDGFGTAENSPELNHDNWQQFLDIYLNTDAFGQTYFNYAAVGRQQRLQLRNYIDYLASINPLELERDEQLAYWINLYNAVTVDVVLEEYPVNSIREIGGAAWGLIPTGPWKIKQVTVNGEALSLDDIEHGIIRPKFQDFRIHFAVNCAAMGCPNLSSEAFTGENVQRLLDEGNRSFVNHQRGVRFQSGRLILSKIYDWYQADFVRSERELLPFLAQYAEPKLSAQLKAFNGSIRYEYDWDLNEAR